MPSVLTLLLTDASSTKFIVAVREASSALQHAVAVYLGAACDFTGKDLIVLLVSPRRACLTVVAEPEACLVLVPDLTLRRTDRVSRYSSESEHPYAHCEPGLDPYAAVPSVIDAIQTLQHVCYQVSDTVMRLTELPSEFGSRHTSVGVLLHRTMHLLTTAMPGTVPQPLAEF
jgi:hypothetical protein